MTPPDRTTWDLYRNIDGGHGGEVIRVTNLERAGPGSLAAALAEHGKRIVVFDVAGVIDLQKNSLVITEGDLTVAGQTAPSPGVTLIRGGLSIQAENVVLQHLRIRPGEAGAAKGSGWSADALSTSAGASRVWIDHCSLTWATDENLSASGPRFLGDSPDNWRASTSHDIVFSHNIIAEGLSHSTHAKIEHSKGILIHDNVSGVLIHGNLLAHNRERNPLLKGGATAVLVNNFIYDPGSRAVHYNLIATEWGGRSRQAGRLTAVGNVLRGGPSTLAGLPFLMLGGDGDLHYHAHDNVAVDWRGAALPPIGRYTTSNARLIEHPQPLDWPLGLEPLPATRVETHVLSIAGARPWDRDPHDWRIVSNAVEGLGRIIDSEREVGGYPTKGTPTK